MIIESTDAHIPAQPNIANSASPAFHDQRGFSLSSLALFVTVIACMLGCIDLKRWHIQYAEISNNSSWMTALFGGAAVVGAFVGCLYVVRRPRTWRLLMTAPIIGVLAGEASIVILLAPGALWRTILAVTVLLVAAIAFRIDAD